MTFSNKPLDSITEADLHELASQNSVDLKKLEFRPALPGRSRSDEREFLYDIASFANAAGGELIYGIENDGESWKLVGLQINDVQTEKKRLERLILDGIEPVIRGLKVQDVVLTDSRHAFVIRIPQGWAGPHWAKHRNGNNFYSRASAGKYLLGYHELRGMFAQCEDRVGRLRQFRLERLGKIVAGETTVSLYDAPKMVLHVFPLLPFDSSNQISLVDLKHQRFSPRPFSSGSMGLMNNFDGVYAHSGRDQDGRTEGYFQIFRNGCVEIVGANFTHIRDGKGHISSVHFEQKTIETLTDVKKLFELLTIEPPFLLMLSVLGVKGYVMSPEHRFWDPMQIDRDNLIIHEVRVEDSDFIPSVVLHPIFDIVWNAAGHDRSENYDKEGRWNPRR